MGTDRGSGGGEAARQRFDVADAAPLLLDARGTVTSWTRDAERILGHPAAEVLGRNFGTLLVPEDAGRIAPLAGDHRGRGGWTGVLHARHRGGWRVRLMVRAVPLWGAWPAEADRGPRPDRERRPAPAGGAAQWVVLLSDMGDAPGWDMSRDVLESMVVRSPVGMAILDTELRFVWSNAALEKFGGGPAHERIGRRLAEVQPGLDTERLEERMRHVLKTGEPVVDLEHVGRVRSAPHRETAHTQSFTRLDDDEGNPLGVYYTVTDVSERHRARMRIALLDRAGEQIGRTLDVARTAQELADVAVSGLADYVAVDLLDSVLSGAEPGPVRGADAVPLRRAGQRSVHEGAPEAVVEAGALATYLPGTPPVRTLAEGVPWCRFRLDPSATEWSDTRPGGRRATFLQLGLHSVLIVPVRARGITLGITTFFRGENRPEPFDEDDLSLAEELVARAAVCVDNARRYTRERNAALVLQRSLLPRRLPEQGAADVAACYRPADELTGLGGDWYDVIPLPGARVALVVGEVAGHGIDGAAAMGRLRTAVRTLADLDLPPEEILAHLDDLVAQSARQEGAEPFQGDLTVGARCLYVVHDPISGACVMAAAGHPPPALVDPEGTVRFADELPVGPPLGVDGPPFASLTLHLPPGTVLALHTDGLLAGASPALLGRALERPSGPSLDTRSQAVVDTLVPARPSDDVVLLLARTRRLAPDRVADWDLPADPALVAQARRTATRQLGTWGLDDLAFTTELVVSELVTNAIRHATGPIRLRLILDRTLICEVFDGGATAPHLRHPRTTDEGGRGLFLISQFTQRWGTRFLPEGKVIWAE
ncbi:SpoIIE family protein phosphatase, partial [Streptomyces sp. CRN 30]|uniref:SpoIIE family protein phosphatase n=1 Tax=Streptomyces sp. CRN 30 TaxID=3075613 RepID=UPI002A80D627